MSAIATPPVALAGPVKPLLRGVSHQIAAFFALAAGAWLTVHATPGAATWCALVYSTCLTGLFTISASYHRPTWSPSARQFMRRLDHAGIFLLIAGTYTPICVLAVPGDTGKHMLWFVWGGATLGMLKSVVWINAPKALLALLCVMLGWAVIGQWTAVHAGIGESGAFWLLTGGALYTAGAVVYAVKRPNPFPATFGYHEIFHALVIAAAVCHFVIVYRLVLPQ